MISKIKPDDFNKRFDIAGCFLLHEGAFVLLHRHAHKSSGDRWGLPAGKVESGESLASAVAREVAEETGVELSPEEVKYFESYYVRNESTDLEWHVFSVELPARPRIQINPYEHKDFKWVTPREAQQMPLIHDLDKSIALFFK